MAITDEQLSDLIKAIGLKRAQLAALCGIGAQAPGWWRFKCRMPIIHFKTLSAALDKKLKRRKELTPLEQRAVLFCQTQLVGSSVPKTKLKSVSKGSRVEKSEAVTELNLISLEDLINEIGRRGGTVIFRKNKIVVR